MSNTNQPPTITMPTRFAALRPDDVYNVPVGQWRAIPAGKYQSKKLFRSDDYTHPYLIVEDKEGDEWYVPIETVANPHSNGAIKRLEKSQQ